MVTRLRAAIVPLVLVGMLGVVALVAARIYSGDLLPRLMVVAAAGSIGLSVLVRRLPAWCAAPVSVLGLAAFTVLAIRLSAASGSIDGPLPDVARDALTNGIPRLLTALIPIEPQPDTVVVPVVATWLAGLAAAELALRNRRVLLSYAGPTALLGGALYLVGPNATPDLWLPMAYAGLAAVGLAASSGGRDDAEPVLTTAQRTTLRVRIAAGAAVGLAAIVALATAVGPTVADRVASTPTDPRRYVTPPRLDSLDENPLARLSGWALAPGQHLFDAKMESREAQAEGEKARIRLAVLGDYDGVTWRVGATYRNAGRVLSGPPSEVDDDAPALEVTQEITIDELGGRLLPAAATPERIDGVRVAYDQATGTLALPEGLRPGIAYTVVSRRSEVEVNLLPGADVPSGAAVARFVTLTAGLPAEMTRLATQLGESNSAPYQRAMAIEQFLAEHYTQVADAPSGHSYPNLNFFLFGPRTGGGQKGTSEQFAAAFAVLGRALGLPTRVVVGFQPRAGTDAVTGADAIAWPEVLFTGLGWVAFDPMPRPNSKPRPVEEDFRPRPDPTQTPPSAAPTVSVSAPPRPTPSGSAPPAATGDDSPAGLILAATGAGGGLLLIGFLTAVPLMRRAQRRRRLRDGSPAARIIGAWAEVLDGLRLSGRSAPAHLAATEVAAYALAATAGRAHGKRPQVVRPPAPPIDDLADLANVVAFAPGQVTAEQADRATAQAEAYVDALRAARSRIGRVLWRLDPRPLRWSRRRSR